MKQFFRFFAATLLLIAAGTLFAYAVRDQVLTPLIRPRLEQELSRLLDAQVRIGRMGGDYFSRFSVGSVHLTTLDNTIDCTIDEVIAEYRVMALVDGIDSFLATLSFDIHQPHIQVQPGSTTPPSSFEDDLRAFSQQLSVLPMIPRVELTDGTLAIGHQGEGFSASGLFLSVRPEPEITGISAVIKATEFALQRLNQPVITAPFNAEITLSANELNLRNLAFGETLHVPEARLELTELAQAALHGEGVLLYQNSRASTTMDLRDGQAQLTVVISGADSAILAGLLSEQSPEVGGAVTGTARITLPINDPSALTAQFNLNADHLRFDTHDIEDVAIEASVANKALNITKLTAQMGTNSLRLAETTISFDYENTWETLRHSEGRFELDLADLPALMRQFGHETPELATIPAHRLKTAGRLTDGKVELHQGSFTAERGRLTISKAHIALPTQPENFSTSAFSLTGAMSFEDLAPTARLFTNTRIDGSLTADISLSGTAQKPRGTFAAQFNNLTVDGRRIGNGRLLGDADSNKIQFREIDLTNGQNHLAGHGILAPQKLILQDFFISASISDLTAFTADHFSKTEEAAGDKPDHSQKKQTLSGSIEAVLTLNGPLDSPKFTGTVDAHTLTGMGTSIDKLHLAAHGTRNHLFVDDLTARLQETDISATAEIRRHTDGHFAATLQAFALQWLDLNLALAAPAIAIIGPDGSYNLPRLTLTGTHGFLELAAQGKGEMLDRLTLSGTGLSSGEWAASLAGNEDFFFTQTDITAELRGQISTPSLRLHGTVGTLGTTDQPVSFTGSFDLETKGENGIIVHQCDWQAKNQARISLTGQVPLDPFAPDPWLPGVLAVQGRISLPDLSQVAGFLPDTLPAAGTLAGDFDLAGTWENPVGHLSVHADRLPAPAAYPGIPAGPYTVDGTITAQEARVELTTLSIASSTMTFAGIGAWTHAPSLPTLLKGDTPQLTGELDLRGQLTLPDLAWIGEKIDAIRRLSGSLNVDIVLAGPIKDPAATGVITLRNAELRSTAQAPAIHNINADASLTGTTLALNTLSGEIGGAPFVLRGDLDLVDPKRPQCNLYLEGKNLLLYRDHELRVRADTNLHLIGPLDGLLLEGNLLVTDGVYITRFDLLKMLRGTAQPARRSRLSGFSLRDPVLGPAKLNIRLLTDTPFIVRNNLSRGAFRADLLLLGTGELPYLTGNIFLEPTSVNLPAGRLLLEAGVLRFPENDPDRITLDISGSSRMIGYEITALFQGTLDDPVITLSSVPPLPEEDLLLLFLAGIPPKQQTNTAISKSGINFAVYLGRDFLARLFPRQDTDSEESLIDRFDLAIGRGVTRQGNETVEASFRFADSIVRKDDTIYLTADKDVFDDFNMGVKIVFRFR